MKKIALSLAVLSLVLQANAGEWLILNYLRGGDIDTPSVVSVMYYPTPIHYLEMTTRSVRVKLCLAEDRMTPREDKAYTVNYLLTLTKNDNTTETITDGITVTSRAEETYYDVSLKEYENVQYKYAQLQITSISENAMPEDLLLELQICGLSRYSMGTQHLYHNVKGRLDSADNALLVTWDYLAGFESYDLEWLFIDNPSGSPALPYDFRNATRINTVNHHYAVSLAYPKGNLLYRVRGVAARGDTLVKTAWSYASNSGTSLPAASPAYRFDYAGLEPGLNWQYTAVYAEEGKRKEVGTYFDGSLRSRQQVTLNNTNHTAIVGETFYDYVGRPVLQSVPAPTIGSGMHYYNSPDGNSGTFNGSFPKSAYATDQAVGDNRPFATNAGSRIYHSSQNPFLPQSGWCNEDAVPRDKGYLYTHTRYKNDGTDRVHSVGSPGAAFKLGGGHHTRYFYGNPMQVELDRLFGNEAGDASHYQKVVTVDANGAATVSYYDMHERLIASSVASGGDNLLPIDGAPPAAVLSETISYGNERRVESRSITVDATGTYTFTYDFSPAGPICDTCKVNAGYIDCEYDIVLSLFNPDIPGYVFNETRTTRGAVTVTQTKNLDIGSYVLLKSVSLRTGPLPGMLAEMRKRQGDCARYEEVEPEPCYDPCEEFCMDSLGLDSLDYGNPWFKACVEECESPAVTYQDECQAKLAAMLADMSPGGQYFDNITQRCPPDTLSGDYDYRNRNGFLNRIETGGAYANWFRQMIDTFRIPSGVPDIYNRLWDSLRANWDDSYAREVFLKYHPEYHLYDYFCNCGDPVNIDAQHQYTNGFMNTLTWQEAANAGYFNPLGMDKEDVGQITDDSSKSGYQPYFPVNTDPYFRDNGGPVCCKDHYLMADYVKERMNNFLTWEHGGTKYYASLWYLVLDPEKVAENGHPYMEPGIIDLFVSLKNEVYPAYMDNFGCTEEDARWLFFKSCYLFLKEEGKARFMESCGVSPNTYMYKESLTYDQIKWHAVSYPEVMLEVTRPYLYADPKCRNALLTPEGYRIHFGYNPLYFIDTKYLGYMQGMNLPGLLADCQADCEAYADSWMAELADYFSVACPGVMEPHGNDWLIFRDKLVNLCKEGCDDIYVNGNWKRSQLLDLDKYGALIETDCNPSGFPDSYPILVHPKPLNYLDCGCDNYQAWLNDHGFTFWSPPDEIEKKLYEEGIRMPETEFWNNFCTKDRYIWMLEGNNDTTLFTRHSFPGLFRCPEAPDWLRLCEAEHLWAAFSENECNKEAALDSLSAAKEGIYLTHCLENISIDRLTVNFTGNELLFTLYYYDQAGNLVRTVPPKGVKPITFAAALGAVKTYRQTAAYYEDMDGFIHPDHTMSSSYRYNTLDQVTRSDQPDHNGATEAFYDHLSRPVISRDPRQRAASQYGYTLYDALGRITETGQLKNPGTMTAAIAADPAALAGFINVSPYFSEVTKTYYDYPFNASLAQERLRNRISAVAVYGNGRAGPLSSATHYSYDIRGNVKRLVQEIPTLQNYGRAFIAMEYEYDLVSGNVNRIWYQKGLREQFTHRYRYDADNRLTHVMTSMDGMLWHCDARYFYYPHGSLARMELGEKQVQGLDYAYTLQGWLKAINAHVNDARFDLGGDGMFEDVNALFPQDLFSSSLYYFPDDYVPVRPFGQPFTLAPSGEWFPLFNGNVAALSTAAVSAPLLKVFQYDKINRLKRMLTAHLDTAMRGWEDPSKSFFSEYTYDFNGNILSLQRNDANAHTMHNIAYTYSPTRNRLLRIQGTGLSSSRYGYDPVGNLTMDHGRGMTVFWNSAGRVTGVDLPEGKTGISYSPAGLRQMKEVVLNGIEHKTTFYLHDASGHVMATYGLENDTLRVEDLYIYGSSRLGAYRLDGVLTFSPNDSVFSRPVGKRYYELTDHLGNVTVTLPDRKTVAAYSANYISYQAVNLSYTDYYPFGFPIQERSNTGEDHRYGFNGQEKDDEIYGEERAYGFDARMYDSRLGRFWSMDKLSNNFPFWTPYQFAGNNPISGIDMEGMEYLDYRHARIKVIGGEAHINLENFNSITRNLWIQRDLAGGWPVGYVGYPTTVGTFSSPNLPSSPVASFDNSYGETNPNYNPTQHNVGNPTAKSTGFPDQRYKQRLIFGGANVRGAAAFTLVLNLVNWSLAQYANKNINEDMDLVKEHTKLLKDKVLPDILNALNSGLIPQQYQNVESLGFIANVVLTGENLTEDPTIKAIGDMILKINGNYKPIMKIENAAPNSSGSDNTKVVREIMIPEND